MVSNRSLASSDGGQFGSGNLLLALVAGDYTLIVDGSGDGTASYSFRLLDLSTATTITPGTPVSTNLTPGNETDLYKFEAVAGDRFSFNQISQGNGTIYWRLIDSYGQQVWYSGFADVATTTLAATGTYALIVEGYVGNPGPTNYSFELVAQGHVDLPPLTGDPMTLGALLSSAIDVAGEVDQYIFTVSDPVSVVLDIQSSLNMVWSLTGPKGAIVVNRAFTGTDSGQFSPSPVMVLDEPGIYQFRVQGNGGTTGSYNLRLVDIATATPLTPGTPVSGSLNPGLETDFYKFDATAGERFFFDDLSQSGGTIYWRLIDPLGRQVFLNSFNNVEPFAVSLTGTYTLTIEGQYTNASPINYSFNVQKVTDTTTALTIGATVNAAIAHAGQQNAFTFSLATAAQLYFDTFTGDGNLVWSLVGPLGTLISGRNFTSSDSGQFGSSPVMTLGAGDYRIIVDGLAERVTGYSFRLLDVAAATPITPGTPVSGSLSPGNETDFYKFDATAGERFFFDDLSQSGGTIYWRLIDPLGRQVFLNSFNNIETFAVSLTGTYTLTIEGQYTNTSPINYSFNVQKVTDTTAALTIGATVNAAIAHAGQQNTFTFSLANTTQLYFDTFTGDGNLVWSLVGPLGTLISGRKLHVERFRAIRFESGADARGRRLSPHCRWERRARDGLQLPSARSHRGDVADARHAGVEFAQSGQRDGPLSFQRDGGRPVLL